ncbi:MAG TPA: lysylphosphatidylglycerol synthase transmembrane domain-containing protein [Polyangiaceae bacterium]|nr:lysylphosphatidylglycerol synthase transmembrane domain-containing protein [Polyangiaceae bacterium]
MNRFLRRVVVAMLLGVVVYGVAVLYAGINAMRASLATYAWGTFALALTLATFNYLVRFLKWQYYLKKLAIEHVPTLDSLLVFLSGFVLTVTPGKVGEVFKSAVLAKTHGVPATRTAPIVVAERLTDAIGVIVLIVLGSAAYAGGLGWALAGTVAVLVGITLIVWERPMHVLLAWLERHPRLGRVAPKLREAYGSLRLVAGPAALLWPTFLSVIAWGAEGLALYVILRGFSASVPLDVAVFFYSTATLAGALVPVPGGLGVAEAMIQEQLVRLGGVEQGSATSAMILIRFATLWWAVLVGFLALFLLRLRFPAELRGDAGLPAAQH